MVILFFSVCNFLGLKLTVNKIYEQDKINKYLNDFFFVICDTSLCICIYVVKFVVMLEILLYKAMGFLFFLVNIKMHCSFS